MVQTRPNVHFEPLRMRYLVACLTACLAAFGAAGCGEPAPTENGTSVQGDLGGLDAPDLSSSTDAGDPEDFAAPGDQSDGSRALDCPGGAGCICSGNGDCQSGFCIDTPAGKACAQKCVSQCGAGYTCVVVNDSGGDAANICVPTAGKLCQPCAGSKECTAVGLANSLCVDLGAHGAFCGLNCVAAADCPAGYDCKSVTSIEGGAAKQCVRLPDSASETAGTCPCSANAVAMALQTACTVPAFDASGKQVGTCKGARKCTAAGLTPCSATAATAEICDGQDNDCDTKVDNGACDDKNPCTQDACDPGAAEGLKCSHVPQIGPCDADGSACTEGDTCASGKCTTGKVKSCDDGNPCSTDSCDPAKGCVSTPDDGAPCDDENLCTLGDKCFAGKCQSGAAKECPSGDSCVDAKCSLVDGKCKFTNKPEGLSCDDGTNCTKNDVCTGGTCVGNVFSCADDNPCTDDSCDAALGCVFKLNNAPCSDGDACTVGDLCKGGLCGAGIAKPCDDGNPCTTESCNKISGECAVAPQALPCSDGNSCTVGDLCKGGACAPGVGKDCNDSNECTTDVCDAATGGCAHLANDAPCSDGNPCTVGDVCQASTCKPAAAKNCSDGDPCTSDSCDATTGACAAKVIAGCGGNCATASDCEDSNPCTENKCLQGKCAFVPNSLPCEDKSPCTSGDLCAGGACVSGPAKSCDDGNPCTIDNCDKATGNCVSTPADGPCSDNNACTVSDSCSAGKCLAGKAKVCDDANPCTAESCQPDSGDCATSAAPGQCDDKNPCTLGDKCTGGKCQAGAAKDCNDGNPCTGDSCDAGSCVHAAIAANCDDGNLCTSGDSCSKGACAAGSAKSCDDGQVCTTDACNPATGNCSNTANKGSCTDGNACTAPDVCADGACNPGVLKNCDDKDACTGDSCDAATGSCKNTPIPGCGGNCLTSKDCSDKNDCTTDTCSGGKCAFPPNFAGCEDGNACTLTDQCSGGSCVSGLAKSCNDDNPCTDDACETATGTCTHKANSAACTDGNPCTVKDLCAATACKPGAPVACSDGNPCTNDSCSTSSGSCVFAPLAVPCSDGDGCTVDDTCVNGTCKAGAVKVCDDANPCTNDSCDPVAGKCLTIANTAPCTDGNACTLGDLCGSGACKAGAAKSCDDSNGCTNDSCDVQSGLCIQAANSAPCSDNNACTIGDVCKSAACASGSPKVCNDGDSCTSDSCDKVSGLCSAAPIIGCGGNCKVASDCDDANPCTDNTCTGGK